MKKLKWLMPTLGVATVVASIPCVATSCSMKYETFSYTFDDTNKAKDFKPEERIQDKELKKSEASPRVLADIKNNNKIFADSMVYTIINHLIIETGDAPFFINPQGTISITINDINMNNTSISYTMSYDLTEGEHWIKADIKVKNLVFVINQTGDDAEESKYGFMSLPSAIAWGTNPSMSPRGTQMYAYYFAYQSNYLIEQKISSDIILNETGYDSMQSCISDDSSKIMVNAWANLPFIFFGLYTYNIPYLEGITLI